MLLNPALPPREADWWRASRRRCTPSWACRTAKQSVLKPQNLKSSVLRVVHAMPVNAAALMHAFKLPSPHFQSRFHPTTKQSRCMAPRDLTVTARRWRAGLGQPYTKPVHCSIRVGNPAAETRWPGRPCSSCQKTLRLCRRMERALEV